MVKLFGSKKEKTEGGKGIDQVWDQSDDLKFNERSKPGKEKTKNKRKKKRYTEEELVKMSSKAETLLDDLLGEDDLFGNKNTYMIPVSKDDGEAINPFDDPEEEMYGEEIDREAFNKLLGGKEFKYKNGRVPVDDDSEEDNEASEDEVADDEPVVSSDKVNGDSSVVDQSKAEEDNSTNSESMKRTYADDKDVDSDSSSDEDVVESTKRLLQMADKRLQYQQHSDEVNKLRSELKSMKSQAEAMSMQLRRAVETKCDLVLAQNEMERCHEQDLIAKDDEIADLRAYVKELMEKQALDELNFMNEISSLSQQIAELGTEHKNELMEKDFYINQLEMKIDSMKTASPSMKGIARDTFNSQFLESRSPSADSATMLKRLL